MDARAIVALRERIVREYNQYGIALIGNFHEAASKLPKGTQDELRAVVRGAERAHRGMIKQSIELASQAVMQSAVSAATRDTGVNTVATFESLIDSDIGDMMAFNRRAAAEDVMAQMGRDGNTVVGQYGQLSYQAKIRYARGEDIDDVRKEALAVSEAMPFTFMDRAGRRWKGERFVRTRLNMHLFHTFNETYLYGLSMMNVDEAALSYLKPNHERQGMRFSISGSTEGLPSYMEVKEKVLNPNSEAVVSQP